MFSSKISKFFNYVLFLALTVLSAAHSYAQQALNLSQQTDAVQTQSISIMSTVGSWLLYSGLGVCTIAIMIQGYKMMFKKHQWSDVGHIFLGAVFIGGAGILAGIFFKVLG